MSQEGKRHSSNASSASNASVAHSQSDDAGVRAMGYAPELSRNRSLFTLTFQLLAMTAIPYGEGAPLINAIYGGGQLTIFVGWIGRFPPHDLLRGLRLFFNTDLMFSDNDSSSNRCALLGRADVTLSNRIGSLLLDIPATCISQPVSIDGRRRALIHFRVADASK